MLYLVDDVFQNLGPVYISYQMSDKGIDNLFHVVLMFYDKGL